MSETLCSPLFVARPPSQGLGFETVALLGCTAHKVSLPSPGMRVHAVLCEGGKGAKLGNISRPPGFERKQIWNPSQVKTHTTAAAAPLPGSTLDSLLSSDKKIFTIFPVSEMERSAGLHYAVRPCEGTTVPLRMVQFNPFYSEIFLKSIVQIHFN
jgi:hypothetical protein